MINVINKNKLFYTILALIIVLVGFFLTGNSVLASGEIYNRAGFTGNYMYGTFRNNYFSFYPLNSVILTSANVSVYGIVENNPPYPIRLAIENSVGVVIEYSNWFDEGASGCGGPDAQCTKTFTFSGTNILYQGTQYYLKFVFAGYGNDWYIYQHGSPNCNGYYGSTDVSSCDVSVNINGNIILPTIINLNQYKSDSRTLISEGQTTTEDTIFFKAVLSDPGNNQVKLQVELKQYNQPFDGQNLLESNFVSSTSEAIIIRTGLVDAQYHWRARLVDDKGNTSTWQEFGTPGNVDFVVHTVPLYTQIVSDYPYRLAKDEWANLSFADGGIGKYSCAKYENATISKCGCAITSMVMLGRYYNINSGIDGTNVNPGSINNWLTNNNGYLVSDNPDVNGKLIWGKAIEYMGTVENGIKKTHLSLDFYNTSSIADIALINNYINSAKPAIAYSSRFGHYFVVDNKLADTYTVKDPRWYETKTLNDNDNSLQYVRGYGNKFSTANLFSYLPVSRQISAAMYLYLASPAEYLITDPQGRRLGIDPATSINYSEIPNATYSLDGPVISSDAPLDENLLHQVKTLYIPDPIVGNYDVKVVGTGAGSYAITSVIYDNNGDSKTGNLYGNTLPGLIANYSLNFNASSSQNTTFAPTDITPPVISHTNLLPQYLFNSTPLKFNFSATDVGVGVFSVTSTFDGIPMVSGQQITFNKLGSHIISITAQDFVGNTATEVINFNINYDFSGFLSPIKTNGLGFYKLGRTLPIKFQLKDAYGNFISNAIAKIYAAKIQDGIIGTDEIPVSTSNADMGNLFRYDLGSNQYIFNFSTNSLSIGNWQLKIVLDDGKDYTVVVLIK